MSKNVNDLDKIIEMTLIERFFIIIKCTLQNYLNTTLLFLFILRNNGNNLNVQFM